MTTTKTTDKMSEQDFLDAAARGDADAVRAALQQGLNVDTADQYGNTALMMACARTQKETCKILLEAGASRTTRTITASARATGPAGPRTTTPPQSAELIPSQPAHAWR